MDQIVLQPTKNSEPSERQKEVLSVVLQLMVEEGDGFSMASVAQRASCSKETLYKWFGDRDGLLTAAVQWQAAKVRMPELAYDDLSLERFRNSLEEFAVSWLSVITGDLSIALNRLAVSHAGSGKSRLGEIVLFNGPFAMARRLEPIFKLGQSGGIVSFNDDDDPFRVFFGLVVSDVQIRALLGDHVTPTKAQINEMAASAANQFLVLFGTNESHDRQSNQHITGE